jgi:rhamnogalacturonan endolyase
VESPLHRPDTVPPGTATLTIAIAAAQPLKANLTQLQVNLNGQPLHTIALPKTGTAGYRGGVQDSKYNVITIPFPTSLLTPGQNTLTLSHTNATPFPPADTDVEFSVGHVMYDALRLELP